MFVLSNVQNCKYCKRKAPAGGEEAGPSKRARMEEAASTEPARAFPDPNETWEEAEDPAAGGNSSNEWDEIHERTCQYLDQMNGYNDYYFD